LIAFPVFGLTYSKSFRRPAIFEKDNVNLEVKSSTAYFYINLGTINELQNVIAYTP